MTRDSGRRVAEPPLRWDVITRRCFPCQAKGVPVVEVYLYGYTWITCRDCAQLGVDHFGFFPREASKRALEDFARREVAA